MQSTDEQLEAALNLDAGLSKGDGDTFESVMRRRFSRRGLLKGAAAAAPLLVLAGTGAGGVLMKPGTAQAAPGRINFQAIPAGKDDKIVVPPGYRSQVLVRWGDALFEGVQSIGSDLSTLNQTQVQQEMRFGYNCDFLGYFPLPVGSTSSTWGLLTVNNEYTNEELMFPGYDARNVRKEQVDVAMAAHGMSIVEIVQDSDKNWSYVKGQYSRRITGTTPMEVTGPAAGHELLKTSADTAGNRVIGMLNNCGGGRTPWGTVLTAEENFNQYFGNLNGLPTSDRRRAMHQRYGVTAGASERSWEKFYDRFDVAKEPNEPFRYGWLVEIDPYNPSFTPRKRTALGRTKHEAANTVISRGGKAVVYSGDDERFDYLYKFVSRGNFNAGNRTANFNLLDSGTLYVAKFNDDGTGSWLPLVYGQQPLVAANGFRNQGDVVINARGAGDALGATKMDRPEDVEVSPVTGKVYMALTNNSNRTAAQVDSANPRASNRHGHIIEIVEAGGDHAATTFTWDILLLAGDPKDPAQGADYSGIDPSLISPVSCPDNVLFDNAGNLWIATDGVPSTFGTNDGLFAVPTEGSERGWSRQFLMGPMGCELASLEFTPDNTTIFASIQHPGEGSGSTLENPISLWPDGSAPPKPSVVAVVKVSGGPVGS